MIVEDLSLDQDVVTSNAIGSLPLAWVTGLDCCQVSRDRLGSAITGFMVGSLAAD